MKHDHILKTGLAFLLSLTVLPLCTPVLRAEEPEEPEITEEAEITEEEIPEETETAEEPENSEEAELLNADIPNTAAYFPDANFRAYLTEWVDKDGNGILSQKERDNTSSLFPQGRAITDLTGLKYFPNIIKLWCDTNSITELDLSYNTKLQVIHVFQTGLTSLDVSHCPDLKELWCYNNFKMNYLNLRNCKNLIVLQTYRCNFSVLDLTDNPLLVTTYQYGTKTSYNDGPHGNSVRYAEAGGELWMDSGVQVKTKMAEPKSMKIDQGDELDLGYEPYMGLPGGWGVLTVTIKPDNASENYVHWTSSDPSVVEVNSDGVIVAKKAGTADIRARISPTLIDTITVTVRERPLVHKFVGRLYKIALDRDPDPQGFMDWTGMLTAKTITAAEAVHGFFLSKEMIDKNLKDEDYVERCYKVMFDRASDPKGKAGWLECLANGVSRTFVVKGFIDSSEFKTTCDKFGVNKGTIQVTEPRDQNYGITSFTARCYVYVLERKFDAKGLNDWCEHILKSPNRKQAAIDMSTDGFYHSPEYLKKKTTNAQYLTSLYWTFLGRKPDDEGYNDWMNHLKNGMSRDEVLYGFAYSPEFTKIMASYGIK